MKTWIFGLTWIAVAAVGCGSDSLPKEGSENGTTADRGVNLNSGDDAGVGDRDEGSPNNVTPNNGGNNTNGAAEPPEGALRVFVTRTLYSGDLDGLEGADQLCANSAAAAELGGNWVAWLSDSRTDAVDRIEGEGPWYRLDGEVAFNNTAQLSTTPLVPLSVDEFKTAGECGSVWTGTDNGGRAKEAARFPHCDDWTTSDSNSFDVNQNLHENNAVAGTCDSTQEWTDHGASNTTFTYDNCGWDRSLYCFELE